MAPEHSGFLAEYPLIRVDNFTASLPPLPAWLTEEARQDLQPGATHFAYPHVSLLSHPHTDHLVGLSSVSQLSAPIYCSEVTKELLLALERKEDRMRYDEGRATRRRPYKHLRRTQQECRILKHQTGTQAACAWDLLVALPFDEPVYIQYNAGIRVRMTLLPANHMPGSTMFLIEGPRGVVLHTGDLRAETYFVEELMARTHLGQLAVLQSPALTSPRTPPLIQTSLSTAISPASSDRTADSTTFGPPRLENLYLDTERLLDSDEPVLRSTAILDVLQLIKLMPRSTRFHVECWTAGYEHFLIGVWKAFGAEGRKIHVDRYKAGLFRIMSRGPEYAGLSQAVSTDKSECGRFCACDDDMCRNGAVIIEPHESTSVKAWQKERQELFRVLKRARKGQGHCPSRIALPIQRHSPLPELYRMIALLRPRHAVANTASPIARFVMARLSEHLELKGADEAEQRQSNSDRNPSQADTEQWERFHQAWRTCAEEAASSVNQADAFFALVSHFRTTLWGQKRLESGRLLLERLDAASDTASASLLPSASVSLLQPACTDVTHPAAAKQTATVLPWAVPGKYASTGASPFMTAAMREARICSPDKAISDFNSGVTGSGEGDDVQREASLTVELASRYLAYAAMYLGWRIRNPSRYRQDIAWRAIRKIKPGLARQTEEALRRELDWAIPPWDVAPAGTGAAGTDPCTEGRPAQPSTPRPSSQALPETISPLDLDRQALSRRLDEEAASQSSFFNDASDKDGVQPADQHVQLVAVSVHESERTKRFTVATDDLFDTVRHVRAGKQPISQTMRGPALFASIVREWSESEWIHAEACYARRPRIDRLRLQHQLNLVGVAAYSMRGRQLLAWEDVDFTLAHRALTTLCAAQRYSTPALTHRSQRIPARARIVQRYLQQAITSRTSPSAPAQS